MSTCIINFNKIELQLQKSDTDHSDNDWMNIIWTINGVPARTDTFPLRNTEGSTVLVSGSVIPPFSRQIECGMGDMVMATYSIVNLGSTDDIKKQAEAAALLGKDITQKAAEIYLEIAQVVLHSGIGTLLDVPQALSDATADVLKAFQDKIIEGIGMAFQDILIPILDEIAKLYGLLIGKPNCNGDVLHDTVSFQYSGTDGFNTQFTKVYVADHVVGCGSHGQTSADIFLSRVEDVSFGPPVKTPFILYGIRSNGDLQWYNHIGHDSGTQDWKTNARPVGTGWQEFEHVFSGGGNIIYAIRHNGDLLWYAHDGIEDGSFNWTGPKTVGTGWNDFTHVFANGGGIIYAITKQGDLLWYRHKNYLTGQPDGWLGPKKIGNGWNLFSHVFSGGGGVIYGIVSPSVLQKIKPLPTAVVTEVQNLKPFKIPIGPANERHPKEKSINVKHRFVHAGGEVEGELYLYIHAGFAKGEMNWFERKRIGKQWDHFTHVFSDGAHIIYGALGRDLPPYKKGDLIWYKNQINYHGAGEIANVEWDRQKISTGGGWNDFKLLFGAIHLPPPVIR